MDAMADVFPFRALRFNPREVSIERVVTQPYDKISKAMQERYLALDPRNVVRVVLGKPLPGDSSGDNFYTRAARLLSEWRDSGVLESLPRESFIAYFQHFVVPGTSEQRVRKGFIGLGQLEDYANKVVFPHERTLAGPKQDRLELLRHTRTHLEQIFVLYEDPARRIDQILDGVASLEPDIDVSDEYGVRHVLWVVSDADAVRRIQEQMRDKKLIIADGHHRYETALAYRNECRRMNGVQPDAPYERLPMTFFNMHDPALAILPTHRVVTNLPEFDGAAFLARASEYFDIEPAPADSEAFRTTLAKSGARRITIGAAMEGRRVLLGLKPLDLTKRLGDLSANERNLDVVVLHRLLIEYCLGITEDAVAHESNITYVREFDAALQAVRHGAQISFLLNPTRLDQLRDIAYDGRVMPQKSTDFYPKVLSGLMLYSLDR
jgi:uncharacterized protein (DUF1015 family)